MPRSNPQPQDRTILVLQGGGALGAYQAGALEALDAAGRAPDWVAGISIGAINAAIIAGNPPQRRIEHLRAFWDTVTGGALAPLWVPDDGAARDWFNAWAAAWATTFGLPAFFAPRPGAIVWPGQMADASYYDTSPLRATLHELVDFELLNEGPVRLSVGAVDVQSGNFAYFDSAHQRISVEHIMASGALPPGFPAVKVGDRFYWDGGMVSNTPLGHVVDNLHAKSATIFQIDLFSARGEVPHTMARVAERAKDIQYSSRTRMVSDMLKERRAMHRRLHELAAMLPPARRKDPKVLALLAGSDDTAITLVQLIHHHRGGETQTKDYEFSRATMQDHWHGGQRDMVHSLTELKRRALPAKLGAFHVYDFTTPLHTEGASQ